MTKKETIIKEALAILKKNPGGKRYSELIREINKLHSDIPPNTISGILVRLDTHAPGKVEKPARGLFKFAENNAPEEIRVIPPPKVKEEDFYTAFAEYIVNELEECTDAIAVGGKKFRDKWGTPDVMGVKKPRKSDIIKSPEEIVSAEIKITDEGLITAFGQTCSYKLFSHKAYIVVPNSSCQEDIARLDSLSLICGIGLILFDASNPTQPNFEIRTRAVKHEPDMFYLNKYLKYVEDELF